MQYHISFEMAIALLQCYLEKIYILDKHKGTSGVKFERLYHLHQDVKRLIDQLREDGHNVEQIVEEIKMRLEPKYTHKKLRVFVDGAARNNNNTEVPNLSGYGFAIFAEDKLIYERTVFLGSSVQAPRLRNEPNDLDPGSMEATNNVAEYCALIGALEFMLDQGIMGKRIEVFSDSNLVVSQVNVTNATRAEHMLRLRNCAMELLDEFENITLTHIPREENEYVDALVNKILDEHEQAMATTQTP